MATYGFDVALKSDVTPQSPATSTNPIAMAFGYSLTPDDGKMYEDGEKTKEAIPQNSYISFQVYDLADDATKKTISSVTISFKDGTAPFDGWANGEMTFSGPQIVTVSKAQSTGCNVTSTVGYGMGGNSSQPSLRFEAINVGTYEMTITVTMTDGTVFQVDPEMDVMAE
ncbi:MAG: hypothetical protein JNK38_09000 [Acidobacteria bacterium]|nr:hypothetical protein [Acidobacteriota bacterium]